MSIGIIAAIIAVSAVGLFLIWRTVRFFIRLAIVGVVVLLVAGLFTWNHWSSNNSKQDDNRPAKTRKSK
jgi:heme/copper-type cytochrome/quinol oxidase subunit 2